MAIDYGLAGKLAVITGAGAGIGRALTLGLGEAGLRLALGDVNKAALEETALLLKDRIEPEALLLKELDVSRGEAVASFAQEVIAELGTPDILISNAGIFPRRLLLEMSEAEWNNVLDVNLKGAFLCVRNFGPAMSQRNGGRIIIMSSSAGFEGVARGVHYSASKAGLVGFVKALALELAPYQITVNAIAPGLTDTAQPRYGLSEEQIAARAQIIPLGRIGTPEDIVNAALWLASAAASYVTGQTIHVNGGALRN